eukprot:gb/GECG01010517.1/.p1 GENE.gb/GECG01010517.1/~~gb/GECG01010517.1/.p1  ORF type:complete len:254 (+),score=27.29 gb/GECG01010517.1/:1-762(+)
MASVDSYTTRGLSDIECGRFQSARETFNYALAHHPNAGDALKGIGDCRLCEGRPQDALQTAREWIQIQPKSGRAYLCKAMAHIEEMEYDQAMLMLNEARERSRHLESRCGAQERRVEGRRLVADGRYTEAIGSYQSASKSLNLMSTIVEKSMVLYDLACCLLEAHKLEQALDTFQAICIPNFKDVSARISKLRRAIEAKGQAPLEYKREEDPSESDDTSASAISDDSDDPQGVFCLRGDLERSPVRQDYVASK